jgi:GNAT superfamily N-acetyltransferase
MFVDPLIARRIERAESLVMRDMVAPLVGSARAPAAFLREVGAGLASFVRPGSPLNKLIGAGLDGAIDERMLDDVERAFGAAGEPVRVELATLADPATCAQLAARGYQLQGFEHALACPLDQPPSPAGAAIRAEPVIAATLPAFRTAVVEGFLEPDDTGVVLDHFTRDVVEASIDDSLSATGFLRYLAYRDGALAGGASMQLHEGVAVLTGSATLAAHRRRGVQAARLARRLGDARAAGATLAVITTAPGTQSQANTMRHGFSLAYARAVLISPASHSPLDPA